MIPPLTCRPPSIVNDISLILQASHNVDYEVSVEDLQAWEAQYGRIPDGALVILYAGWDRFWGDPGRFLGTGREKATWSPTYTNMHFPGNNFYSMYFCSCMQIRDIYIIAKKKKHGLTEKIMGFCITV